MSASFDISHEYSMRQGPPVSTTILTLWPWCLTYFLNTFNLVKNFWTGSASVYTYHMNICSGKVFPWVPTFFITLWPWNLTCFLKTLTFLKTFEQWVLELWYFTWIFYETRPSRILTLWPLPWSLTYFLKTFSLVKNFELSSRTFDIPHEYPLW